MRIGRVGVVPRGVGVRALRIDLAQPVRPPSRGGRIHESVVLTLPGFGPRLDLRLDEVELLLRVEGTWVGELAGGEYAAGIARTAAIDTGFILVLQAVGASGRVGTSVRLRFGIGVRASRARGVVGAGYDK